MEAANIGEAKFHHGGALVLDPKLKGPVKHALDDQETGILHTLEFDPNLNEIVDIGSKVEVINVGGTTPTTEGDTAIGEAAKVNRRAQKEGI
ncbi:hypothetical protein Q1695_012924 [Nippostrongylus brasiliensis]|nr:hypothetical protein Q1695_012924 [Nippostrongylus brasiliensis]